LLLARLGGASRPDLDGMPGQLTARQALELATRGGAAALGRSDLGSLEPGKCADFVAIDLNRIEYAGGLHDPVAAIVMCSPVGVDYSYVHGRAVVREGKLVGVDIMKLTREHNLAARRLVDGDR
jgi:cytosine/adenosine deaminase-related metal-dependent hydrolase